MQQPGLTRVWTLCESLLDYLASDTFSGGCFFCAASSEYDDRPGPVRDRLVEIMREWLNTLTSIVGEAKSARRLTGTADAPSGGAARNERLSSLANASTLG